VAQLIGNADYTPNHVCISTELEEDKIKFFNGEAEVELYHL
jgi:hypothetical protein